MSPTHQVTPQNVHEILNRHILTDGYDIVLDLEKSRGSELFDARSGKSYLDMFTFFASNPLGMNHPALDNEEFRDKIGRVAVNKPSNSDVYTEAMAEFVDNFDRTGIPDYLPHSFFIAGGALAVENALKVAFDWKVQKNFEKGYRTEKGHKVLHFEQAFHGRSGYTLSLTNTDPRKVRYFPKFDWPRVVSPAMEYPENEERTENTRRLEQKALSQAERHFAMYPDEIAAIIIEPIQGEGGDRHFRPEFHQALRDLADRHETLLIHDEVQTGVGLTGRFWAHEHYVKPDILAFGKKAQVCGILAGKRIDEVPDNCFKVSSRINSTWGGNLVDMVRFGRILQVIEEENLVENAAAKGAFLLEGLQQLSARHEELTNPRGKGLMCAIDLPDTATRDAVRAACFERRMMILGCGDRTIRFRPPLNVEEEVLSRSLEILEEAFKATAGG